MSFEATDNAHAAGLIMRIQQAKQMRQRPTQADYERHQLQQQREAQAQGQSQGQQAPAPPTYQQTVDQRNQAIAQAIINAHNQAIASESVPLGNTVGGDQTETSPVANVPHPPVATPMLPSTTSTDVKDVVDLSEVWKKLDSKSTVWTLLIDDQAKALTVSEYIDRFRQQGVKINAPPEHYVQLIDQVVQQNSQLLQRPFGDLLQMLAIVDYDFDNGMDKDALAKAVLGEAAFEANKKRFTQQQSQ